MNVPIGIASQAAAFGGDSLQTEFPLVYGRAFQDRTQVGFDNLTKRHVMTGGIRFRLAEEAVRDLDRSPHDIYHRPIARGRKLANMRKSDPL